MTQKEIQKYFDQRPKANELYSVGSIVFINQSDADQYATETGMVVETHLRNNPETGDESQETEAKIVKHETVKVKRQKIKK